MDNRENSTATAAGGPVWRCRRAGAIASVTYAIGAALYAWAELDRFLTPNRLFTLAKLMLYHESGLMFPALVFALFRAWRSRGAARIIPAALALFMVLGIYARYIEPERLRVEHHVIPAGFRLRVALVSDLHLGIYSPPERFERLVDQLNALDVDLVAVAGDWTNEPRSDIPLTTQLAPLRRLRHPVYSVPGNHDAEMPGPPVAAALRQGLLANGVIPVEGKIVDLGAVRLVGLAELWSCANGVGFPLETLPTDKPLLLLAHHPEAAESMPRLPAGSLLMAGHTHGGQVYLPWLTYRVLKGAHWPIYRKGFYDVKGLPVFITSGIGMVGLPIRFRVPPVIDVLEFR